MPAIFALSHRTTIIDQEHPPDAPLELHDVLVIQTNDGVELQFEVVGLVEDDDENAFAVAYSEQTDEFVVTDARGKLLDDPELAQEVLDDFFAYEESASSNGESSGSDAHP